MESFSLSNATLNALNKLMNQKPNPQDIIVEEWCKCTGMD